MHGFLISYFKGLAHFAFSLSLSFPLRLCPICTQEYFLLNTFHVSYNIFHTLSLLAANRSQWSTIMRTYMCDVGWMAETTSRNYLSGWPSSEWFSWYVLLLRNFQWINLMFLSIVMLILMSEPASCVSRADSHSILVSYVRRFKHKWRSRYPDLGKCFLRFLTN